MNQEAPYRFQRKSEKPRFHLFLYFFLSIPPPCFGKELETPFAILYSQSPLKRRCLEAVKNEKAEVLVIGAGIESDIAELDTYEEKQMLAM